MTTHKTYSKGFTLLETLVYIALLGLILTTTLLSVYDLLGSTRLSGNKATVEEEGTFVERKLEWALADMGASPTISGSSCAQTLSIQKTGYAKNPVEFRRNTTNNTIEIREGGGGAFTPITTSNVSVTCFVASAILAQGTAPPGVVVTTTINGLTFVNTKYVRQ